MMKVLGGGVAGLSAAIKLADAGHMVTVYEKFGQIGQLQGNDAQAIRNYGMTQDQLAVFKEQGLKVNYVKSINKIVKYAPSGKSMEVFSENGPLFYVFKRGTTNISLDSQLYDLALDRDVKFKFNEKKSLNEGDIVAVQAIYRNIWAYGAVFKGVKVDPETIHFFMDNNYCPQGYIYALPYGKHEVTIALTSYDVTAPLPILFEKFIKENRVMKRLVEGGNIINKFGGYAYSNIPLTAEISGHKFVGAAAGFVEAARGFGIKYAIQSGQLAAQAINEKTNYDKLWKSAFEQELLDGFKRRMLLERMSNSDYAKLILDDKVSIKKYDKLPRPLRKLMLKFAMASALAEWRKKYDLQKLFL